jgi:hypothetical protein
MMKTTKMAGRLVIFRIRKPVTLDPVKGEADSGVTLVSGDKPFGLIAGMAGIVRLVMASLKAGWW